MSATLDQKLRQAAAALAAGDHPGAERLSREILEQAPLHAHALTWLGIALAAQGRHEESLGCFQRAASAEPGNPGAHLNVGNAAIEVGEWQQAVHAFRQALVLQPAYPEALNSLGVALVQQGGADEAIACYRKALDLRPDYAEADNNLGHVLLTRGEEHAALACFRRAAVLQPDNAEFHHDLGTVLAELNSREEAAVHYERALALSPGNADSRYSLAVLRLFRREFEPGWRDYESRFQCGVRSSIRKSAATVELYERLTRWRGPGEAGTGDVAVWGEQGLGDQVLFSTLLPGLIEAKVSLVYEVDRRLLGAYERAFPEVRFVPYDEPPHEALQRASRVLMAGSLPGLFRRSRSDFARQPIKLLSALPARAAHYRKLLARQGPGLKVALSWWSSRKDYPGPRKSAPLADFAPLLELAGVQFLDVQYGNTEEERAAVEKATGARLLRFDEVDYFNDLEELLALLEACDLVITTSNVTAHFAGALGKPTRLLYLADRPPFHYWAHDGSHCCLWYPSVEIVTARNLADWASLLRHVAAGLRPVSGGHGSSPLFARQPSSPSRMPPSDPKDWRERAASLRRAGKIE
jgi:Flp pilus assembly protein TadD